MSAPDRVRSLFVSCRNEEWCMSVPDRVRSLFVSCRNEEWCMSALVRVRSLFLSCRSWSDAHECAGSWAIEVLRGRGLIQSSMSKSCISVWELLSSGRDVPGQSHVALLRRASHARCLTHALWTAQSLQRTRLSQVASFVLLLSSSCWVQQQLHCQQVMFASTLLHVCEDP